MRGRRGRIFVIGEERVFDEEELGVEAAAVDGRLEPAAAGDAPPIKAGVDVPPVPLGLRRWTARGGAIASTLIVGVLMVSALLRGGQEERRAPTVAPIPGEPSQVDPPLREPHASRGRERPRKAVSSAPERAEGEPERREQPERDANEHEATPAEPATATPSSEVGGEAAASAAASAPVSAPAPAPSTLPAPSPAPSSGGGAPAVASASEVRQEFGP